ncbi:hypothetical protein PTSG_11186 [Salpingoeca rosetta]|uniref:Tectonic-1-3 N-terminal domain-containing protein n=1 Tax=Salpingoeca rosetta (strain ATCC 50818 / BSB-021) TaxID=946362 RepID=F2USN8_SALR5|nr:uncharacterized protein PTSG_11186 [Salpingoeca rosetta]EGD81147.1 hypothetical protein PTSG_11186 [Salpingoeca rosetta]|eukprot:XP_004987832.1 hypothetical protein PTSG_11186 [Salpingoeca rosetta]
MVRRASMCRRAAECDATCCCDPSCTTLVKVRFAYCNTPDIKPWRRCVYDDFFVTNEGRNQAIQVAEDSSIACVLVDNTNDRISFREPRTPLNDAAFQAFADAARPRPISFSLETLQYTPEAKTLSSFTSRMAGSCTSCRTARRSHRFMQDSTTLTPLPFPADTLQEGEVHHAIPPVSSQRQTMPSVFGQCGCDGDCTIHYNASTQHCINAVQKVEYTIQLGLTTISSLNVAVTVASFDASATRTWPQRNVNAYPRQATLQLHQLQNLVTFDDVFTTLRHIRRRTPGTHSLGTALNVSRYLYSLKSFCVSSRCQRGQQEGKSKAQKAVPVLLLCSDDLVQGELSEGA